MNMGNNIDRTKTLLNENLSKNSQILNNIGHILKMK